MGRFCRGAASPRSRWPYGHSSRLQIGAGGLPAHAGFLLDAAQWPAQPPQCDDLITFLFAQDIAHADGA